MAKLKVDMNQIKSFLIARGERVALMVAGTITLLLVGMGLWSALSATSPHEDIEKAARALQGRVESADPPADVKADQIKPPVWDPLSQPEHYFAGAWYDPGAVGDSKARNPLVLPVDTLVQGNIKQIEVNVVRAPIFTYHLNSDRTKVFGLATEGAKQTEAAQQLALHIQPQRLVVVHATFPYRDQVEIIRKALRKDSPAEVLQSTPPRFLGLNVQRCEVGPDGKQASKWVDIYSANPRDGSVVVSSAIKEILTQAVFDDQSDSQWLQALEPGLATPLPALAFGSYPPLTLSAFATKPEEGEQPGSKPGPMTGVKLPMPMGAETGKPGGGFKLPGVQNPMAGGNEAAAPTVSEIGVDFKYLISTQPQLVTRFKGKITPFHPRGENPETPADGGTPGVGKPMPPVAVVPMPARPVNPEGSRPMGATNPADPEANPAEEKKLVRFFDAGLQPGKTYAYSIQVRLQNPNFGPQFKKLVQYPQLAEIKELLSPWVTTPTVPIGPEFNYYVVDELLLEPQKFRNRVTRGIDDKAISTYYNDRVAVQLQTWVEKFRSFNNSDRVGGDWGVAERLLLARGEPIARSEVEVLFPEWNVTKNAFQVGAPPATATATKKGLIKPKAGKTGVKIDFGAPHSAPLVVDFQGGKTRYAPGGFEDESSVELLVLTPDGRLQLRTSREDGDRTTSRGQERFERHQHWVQRVTEAPPPTATPGGPMLPGTRGSP